MLALASVERGFELDGNRLREALSDGFFDHGLLKKELSRSFIADGLKEGLGGFQSRFIKDRLSRQFFVNLFDSWRFPTKFLIIWLNIFFLVGNRIFNSEICTFSFNI